jgi:hypothetical protein
MVLPEHILWTGTCITTAPFPLCPKIQIHVKFRLNLYYNSLLCWNKIVETSLHKDYRSHYTPCIHIL